jgi:hypothetical protein
LSISKASIIFLCRRSLEISSKTFPALVDRASRVRVDGRVAGVIGAAEDKADEVPVAAAAAEVEAMAASDEEGVGIGNISVLGLGQLIN